MTSRLTDLSKTVSHALRHQPWLYELELDAEGWTPVADLLDALNAVPRWREVTRADLPAMMAAADKQRFELDGDRIRALYGHSVPGRILKERAEPPAILLHGTAPGSVPAILEHGLLPMRRQYVHLSVDHDTARQVGGRRTAEPVILTVRAADAHAAGLPFWHGNEMVWLAESVPPQFLEVP
jgi:putative RNA 2'-phosphotransferase